MSLKRHLDRDFTEVREIADQGIGNSSLKRREG
jgi:hypothetical protein